VLVLVVFVGYRRYANVLKVLGMFLLAYLVTVFAVSQPWGRSSSLRSFPTSN
jgi:Mn2+/Fe2+ NRAMP family transporter